MNKEKLIALIKLNILGIKSSLINSKPVGINNKIIPNIAIKREKYWCLKISSFNINLEKRGIKNIISLQKVYILEQKKTIIRITCIEIQYIL